MPRKRFSVEQIINHLRETEVLLAQSKTVGEICRRIGVSEQSYYRWRRGKEATRVTVSWSGSHPEAAGRDLTEIAAGWGCDAVVAIGRLQPAGAIYHQMDEADRRRILSYPPSLVGSDGLPHDKRPHPRLWGAFPRVFARYVREQGLLSLEAAVAKMTGQTAAVLGLAERGLIRPGYQADLVLFDAQTVADRATYEDPLQPAVGIDCVLVNGAFTYETGALTESRPGRFLAA